MYKLKFFIQLIITIILIRIVMSQIEYNEVIALISLKSSWLLIIAIILQIICIALTSIRSRIYLKSIGIYMTQYASFYIYYIGNFYNNFLPGGVGGDGYKIYLLSSNYNKSKLKILRLFFCERVNGVFVLFFLGLIFAAFSELQIIEYHYSFYIAMMTLSIIGYWIINQVLLKDICIMQTIHISIASQILQLIMAYCIIIFFCNDADYGEIINYTILFIIASIASILPLTLGGIGIREAIFIMGSEFMPSIQKEQGMLIASTTMIVMLIASLPGGFLIKQSYMK